jgi:release factor glutamine methyltransferase
MIQDEIFNRYFSYLSDKLDLLPDKPEETVEATLRVLWFTAKNMQKSIQQVLDSELPELEENEIQLLEELINKRLSGVPLGHISGIQQFMGVEFQVGPEALIPRKETEIVGFAALEKLKQIVDSQDQATVVDVCTGSGNLALAFAYHQGTAKVYGSDLSADAVSMANKNKHFLKVEDRVEFRTGDLLEPFREESFFYNVDLLTCNPPYISSKKLETMPAEIISHEPKLAFDGGPFGIKILQKLIKEAPDFLKRDGWLAFEVGLGQGAPMKKSLERNPAYKAVESVNDEAGEIRAILAQKE